MPSTPMTLPPIGAKVEINTAPLYDDDEPVDPNAPRAVRRRLFGVVVGHGQQARGHDPTASEMIPAVLVRLNEGAYLDDPSRRIYVSTLIVHPDLIRGL